jgi:hypothetical protein
MKKKFFIWMFSIPLVLGLVMTGCDLSFLDDLSDSSSSGDSSGSADGEIPTKPKNLKVIPDTESTMILEWSKGSSYDDVIGYNICRSIESSSSGFEELVTVSSRTFTDTGLSSNTRYYYYVTAYQ